METQFCGHCGNAVYFLDPEDLVLQKKIYVFLNVQHKLLPPQEAALNEKFGGNWEIFPIPAEGWNEAQQREVLANLGVATLVFASPVTLLLMLASKRDVGETFVFHNDLRQKQEVTNPDGTTRVIWTLAPEGWKIL